MTHALHALCNGLVAVAVEHRAQLALQDIAYLRERRPQLARDARGQRSPRRPAVRDARAEAQYRLTTLITGTPTRILGYKLPLAALPGPLLVGGVSPRDCVACGGRGATSDRCDLCGADLGLGNTAVVVARRVADVLRRIDAARTRRAAQDTTAPVFPNNG